MAPTETENYTYATFLYFRVTNKEHYDMLWNFMGWSIDPC